MTRPAAEIELVDASGNVYPLEFPDRLLQEISGLGMPPLQHWATRAPFQTGQTHWGYAVQPRTINVSLYTKGCTRSDMYAKRRATIELLNPMNGPHRLRLTTPPPDPRKYELHNVYVTGGYELSSADQPTPRRQMGVVQLTAYDPIWKWLNSPLDAGETRSGDGMTCRAMGALTTSAELTIPFTGPFLLGVTTATATWTCTNDGSWAVKPVITVTGPVDDWTLTNAATGKTMSFNGYSIAAGEVVTINVPNKTITNVAGTNLVTYVSGDYGTFVLNPGANAITFYAGSGTGVGTAVSVCWYVELLGV